MFSTDDIAVSFNLDKPTYLQTTAPIVHFEGGEIGHKNNTCSRRRTSFFRNASVVNTRVSVPRVIFLIKL